MTYSEHTITAMPPRELSDRETHRRIQTMIRSNTITEAAEALGLSKSALNQFCANRDFTPSDLIGKETGKNRLYSFNESVLFEDTPDAAYWRGFLLADGCNREGRGLQITLASKDRGHLEEFATFMESNSPISDFTRGGNRGCTLAIWSKEFSERLTVAGIPPRKTMIVELPVNDPNLPHLVRGLWDGDSSITITSRTRSASFTGAPNMVEGVRSYVEALDCRPGKIHQKGANCSQFTVKGAYRLNRLLIGLKADAHPRLDRKWRPLEDLIEELGPSIKSLNKVRRSEETIGSALRDLADGLSYSKTAAKYGVSIATIHRWKVKYGS